MTNSVYKNGSSDTPKIVLDADKSIFLMEGPFYPENPFEIFDCVTTWLNSNEEVINKGLICNFKFKVLSSISKKLVYEILQGLEKANENIGKIVIHWQYEEYDEDILEVGEVFSDMVKIPFKIFPA